ncbi:MAG: hypothetical protein ACOCWB_09020 [Bacteroidota bacterium]
MRKNLNYPVRAHCTYFDSNGIQNATYDLIVSDNISKEAIVAEIHSYAHARDGRIVRVDEVEYPESNYNYFRPEMVRYEAHYKDSNGNKGSIEFEIDNIMSESHCEKHVQNLLNFIFNDEKYLLYITRINNKYGKFAVKYEYSHPETGEIIEGTYITTANKNQDYDNIEWYVTALFSLNKGLEIDVIDIEPIEDYVDEICNEIEETETKTNEPKGDYMKPFSKKVTADVRYFKGNDIINEVYEDVVRVDMSEDDVRAIIDDYYIKRYGQSPFISNIQFTLNNYNFTDTEDKLIRIYYKDDFGNNKVYTDVFAGNLNMHEIENTARTYLFQYQDVYNAKVNMIQIVPDYETNTYIVDYIEKDKDEVKQFFVDVPDIFHSDSGISNYIFKTTKAWIPKARILKFRLIEKSKPKKVTYTVFIRKNFYTFHSIQFMAEENLSYFDLKLRAKQELMNSNYLASDFYDVAKTKEDEWSYVRLDIEHEDYGFPNSIDVHFQIPKIAILNKDIYMIVDLYTEKFKNARIINLLVDFNR